jgi:hypothetical protein
MHFGSSAPWEAFAVSIGTFVVLYVGTTIFLRLRARRRGSRPPDAK